MYLKAEKYNSLKEDLFKKIRAISEMYNIAEYKGISKFKGGKNSLLTKTRIISKLSIQELGNCPRFKNHSKCKNCSLCVFSDYFIPNAIMRGYVKYPIDELLADPIDFANVYKAFKSLNSEDDQIEIGDKNYKFLIDFINSEITTKQSVNNNSSLPFSSLLNSTWLFYHKYYLLHNFEISELSIQISDYSKHKDYILFYNDNKEIYTGKFVENNVSNIQHIINLICKGESEKSKHLQIRIIDNSSDHKRELLTGIFIESHGDNVAAGIFLMSKTIHGINEPRKLKKDQLGILNEDIVKYLNYDRNNYLKAIKGIGSYEKLTEKLEEQRAKDRSKNLIKEDGYRIFWATSILSISKDESDVLINYLKGIVDKLEKELNNIQINSSYFYMKEQQDKICEYEINAKYNLDDQFNKLRDSNIVVAYIPKGLKRQSGLFMHIGAAIFSGDKTVVMIIEDGAEYPHFLHTEGVGRTPILRIDTTNEKNEISANNIVKNLGKKLLNLAK